MHSSQIGDAWSASGGVGSTPYTGDIEIRVHGVSGTPPEDLLNRAVVAQVAGDRVAGFYRPAVPGQQRDVPVGCGPDDPVAAHAPWLEGYSWGGWTSGARTRALWIILAPFALVNVAPRMLPPDPAGSSDRLRRFISGMIRVLAASLTITMVLGVAIVSMVTVGRRCPDLPESERSVRESTISIFGLLVGGEQGAVPASPCYGLPGALTALLAKLSPAGQLGLMAIVPVLLVLVMWLIGWRAATRYATGSAEASSSVDRNGLRADDDALPLARPDLWTGGYTVQRLRLLHVQIGFTAVIGVLCWLFPASGWRTTGLLVVAVTLTAGLVLVAKRPRVDNSGVARAAVMWPARGVWLGVAGSVGCVLVQVLGNGPDPMPDNGFDPDGMTVQADRLVLWLFFAQSVWLLVILVLLAVSRVRGAGKGRTMFMNGYGAAVFAFLGCMLGSILTASVLVLVPAWLSSPGFVMTPGRLAEILQAHPLWWGDTTRSAAIGMLWGLVVLVVLLGQLVVRALISWYRGGSGLDRARFAADYPGESWPVSDVSLPWLDRRRRYRASSTRHREVGFVFWSGRRVDEIPTGIVVFALLLLPLLVAQGIAMVIRQSGGAQPAFFAFVIGQSNGSQWVALGSYLTAAMVLGLLIVGFAAYRTAVVRRGVGVLWDLGCFWQRDTHPLAPPCYNERIMTEVQARIDWYVRTSVDTAVPGVGDPGDSADGAEGNPGVGTSGRVVIAGHSQGSVIALAAVLLLGEQTRRRVALLTFGCVLDRLYARLFPRYFGPEVFEAAAAGIDQRWRNLWRYSDYLGGAVPHHADHPLEGEADIAAATNAGAGTTTVADIGSAAAGNGRDHRLVDPRMWPADGQLLPPVAWRHSAFWIDPEFQNAVGGLLVNPIAER